jgi:hypothetical protein
VQNAILASLLLLSKEGALLGRPHVDTLKGSRFPNLKELRVQHPGKPWRILFLFDRKREGILLLGGNKGGDDDWCIKNIPLAEKRYEEHLEQLETKKGASHGHSRRKNEGTTKGKKRKD